MKMLAMLFLTGAVVAGTAQAGEGPGNATHLAEKTPAHPQINSHVMFLYYRDLSAAERFYGGTLGLKKTLDKPWVKLFQLTEHSYVGLVDELQGTHRSPSDSPPVMLSIETTDLEGWQRRLKAHGVTFVKELELNSKQPLVDSMLLKDPAGYSVEFYRWK